MTEAAFMALRANLKSLLLSSMAGELETHLRQARESRIGYGLVNELIESRQERSLQRLIQKYAHCDLLILDELVIYPFTRKGRNCFSMFWRNGMRKDL